MNSGWQAKKIKLSCLLQGNKARLVRALFMI